MSGTEGKQPLTPEFQRKLAMIAFWGTIIAALIGAVASVLVSSLAILPRLPAREYIYYAKIPASEYPITDSHVNVESGDEVEIIVEGLDAYWDCGKGKAWAEGLVDDKWIGTLMPSANQCELIGYIHEGVFFRVGAYEQFVADRSGVLHLGANDLDTAYADNSGELNVIIIVKRK